MKKSIFNLMAIIMIATMIVGLYSCSKDDDNTPTTYTLKWNTETYGVDDVMCFEYTGGGDKIGNKTVDNITKNGTYKFTASEKAEKVKVYFEIGGSPRWIQQIFFLKAGTNTDIQVTDKTIVGRKEP